MAGCVAISILLLREKRARHRSRDHRPSKLGSNENYGPVTKNQNGNRTWAESLRGGKMALPFEEYSGSPYGLLAGVDIYVVETEERKGFVQAQAQEYGIPQKIKSVAAFTPETKGLHYEIMSIERECQARSELWEGRNLQVADFPIGAKAISCTLSHLKALQAACDKKHRQRFALILEDDANFEPLLWWPEPVKGMLSDLPFDWTIVSAAISNFNEPCEFRKGNYFCRHEGINHYGAVAIIYNIGNPLVCSLVRGKSPVHLLRNATTMCQPSDMLIFKEFGGPRGAFATRMPLFYFSQTSELPHPGAIHNHSVAHAEMQRSAWAEYVEQHTSETAGIQRFIPRRCKKEGIVPYLLRLSPFFRNNNFDGTTQRQHTFY